MQPGDSRSSGDANVIQPPATHAAEYVTRCNCNPIKGRYGPGSVRSVEHATTKTADCCLNGGLCVLRSFCHCPKNFHGRHCEYFMRRRPCGPVKHDTWQRRGCNLCRCVDGILASDITISLYPFADDVPTSTNSSAEPVMYNFRKTKQDRKNSIQLSSNDRNGARHWSTWLAVVTTCATYLIFVCC
ncbi:hypothetical protein NP493_315g03084 [Ridgeia piscesae]|uniref:EGF-like domain-containing protein n=1 Tax=Ridgeia piscesae TaxID=27915 RepID=A0AAD9L5P4_RIDPI|nr:hypothetical protein NP493_315g03084 [Ridgeia piscesae]